MRMSEECRNKHNNNNSDNPLTSRRIDGGKNRIDVFWFLHAYTCLVHTYRCVGTYFTA